MTGAADLVSLRAVATRGPLVALTATWAMLACEAPPKTLDLVFLDGRGVAFAGDSLLAFTRGAVDGVLVLDRRSGRWDTLAAGVLRSPLHVEHHGGRWFVSDVVEGRPRVVVLAAGGSVERTIDLGGLASAPHQFAVLPNGPIVVESTVGELVRIGDGGEVTTFAIVEQSPVSGLVAAAHGGVLHAVPGRSVTLYNAQGNIRWRLRWPWHANAYVSDIAVDAHGRIHLLAGEAARQGFVVFSLSPINGEVVRWSEFGSLATFVVDRLGTITADSAARWLGPG